MTKLLFEILKKCYLIFLFDVIIDWFIFIQFLPQILYCVIFTSEHLFQIFISTCLTKSLLQSLAPNGIRDKISIDKDLKGNFHKPFLPYSAVTLYAKLDCHSLYCVVHSEDCGFMRAKTIRLASCCQINIERTQNGPQLS